MDTDNAGVRRWHEYVGFGVSICLLLFDIGWLMEIPSVFLLGIIPGLILQTLCWVISLVCHSSFNTFLQSSMLLWVIGNFFWAGSELIWPPIGLFMKIKFFAELDEDLNAPIMMISTGILVLSMVVLSAPYWRLLAMYRRRRRARQVADMLLNANCSLNSHTSRSHSHGTQSASHDSTSCDCINLFGAEAKCQSEEWFRLLYVLPFIAADAAWCGGNLLQLFETPDWVYWGLAASIALTGILSVALGFKLVYVDIKHKVYRSAALVASDVLWVLANVVWAVQDVLANVESDDLISVVTYVVLAIFIVSGVGLLASFCIADRNGSRTSALLGVHSVISFQSRLILSSPLGSAHQASAPVVLTS